MAENRGKILFIDDSRSVRVQISGILTNAGYTVQLAGNGQEGLEWLQQNEVDLILSDVEMPLLNGFELCRAVKADQRLRHIYFILLTARTELSNRVQGLDIGADDYIVKTTHPAELLARVQAGLRFCSLDRELQRTQAHLFHAEKMASLGQLSAGLAHEINNPLSYIRSNLGALDTYLTRLSGFIADQDKVLGAAQIEPAQRAMLSEQRRRLKVDQILDDGKELISESRNGGEIIARIVSNLRSFLDVQAYENSMTDLNQSLDMALVFLQHEFNELPPPHCDYTEIPLTRCYSQQLNQVFVHLLRNAFQAVVDGGEISISSRCVGDEIILQIVDTGGGIDAENLARIYDPFFTTRPVGQGAGLGLTVVYDIVHKHGGDIAVESLAGKGSTFTVRLPVQS